MSAIKPIGGSGDDLPLMQELAAELAAAPVIGLDTEFLRERTYRAQLCLLQVATPARYVLVDPLDNRHLALLSPALAAREPVKILHAARQDLEVLYPALGPVAGLFDTQVAAALAWMAWPSSLGTVVESLTGYRLGKAHTFTNWDARPLTPAQLAALTDFGYHVGLAFQVIDDILDVTQTSEQLGKTAGKDVAVQKATYPSIVGLEASRKIAAQLTAKAFGALKPFRGKAAALEALAEYLLKRNK
jgi:ribonuclease D